MAALGDGGAYDDDDDLMVFGVRASEDDGVVRSNAAREELQPDGGASAVAWEALQDGWYTISSAVQL